MTQDFTGWLMAGIAAMAAACYSVFQWALKTLDNKDATNQAQAKAFTEALNKVTGQFIASQREQEERHATQIARCEEERRNMQLAIEAQGAAINALALQIDRTHNRRVDDVKLPPH